MATNDRYRERIMLFQDQIVRCGVAVVIRRAGEVLFIKRARSHGAGTWSVPGGWMDFGEDPLEAAIREVKEETGLRVHVAPPARHGFTVTNDVFREDGKHCITLWFEAEPLNNDEPTFNLAEVSDSMWARPFESDMPKPLFLPLKNRLWLGPL